MALYKRGHMWWYEFIFAGRRVREPARTSSKTVAKQAEQNRRRELEKGFNGVDDTRKDRVISIRVIAAEYLDDYRLRHKSGVFATYAVRHITRHLGGLMAVDVSDATVREYQTARLKENAAPKSINEEVGFLLRLLGESGDVIGMRLRREKTLRLSVGRQVGKAYTPEEKAGLLAAAREARSPAIYPALMLALNAGMRDAEIRGLQWERVDLKLPFLPWAKAKPKPAKDVPSRSTLPCSRR